MALHERFEEYTKEEIKTILKENCMAHNCPYLCGLNTARDKRRAKEVLINKCCMYLVRAHKMRDCMPDECEHWKDKNVKKEKDENEY